MDNLVFISYAKENTQEAQLIYRRIRKDGYNPWLDEHNLLPGYDWDKEIKKAIQNAKIFLLLLSKSTITKRGYIQKEIKTALDYAEMLPEGSIYIVPVKIEECEVPELLSKWQWIDIHKYGGYKKIIETIAKVIPKEEKVHQKNKQQEVMSPSDQILLQKIQEHGRVIIFNLGKNRVAISDGRYLELMKSVPEYITNLEKSYVSISRGTKSMFLRILPEDDSYKKDNNKVIGIEKYDNYRHIVYTTNRTIISGINIGYWNIINLRYPEVKIYIQKTEPGIYKPLIAENKNKIVAVVMPMILD